MEMHILSDSMHQTEIDISYICHHQQLNSEKKGIQNWFNTEGASKGASELGWEKNIALHLNVTFGLLERPPGEIYDKSALVTQSVHFIQ